MNILNEIDSVLYYENIANLWRKHKTVLIGGIIVLFSGVAAFNLFGQELVRIFSNDADVILNVIQQRNIDGYQEKLEEALTKVKTIKAKQAIKLELVKEFYKANDEENLESTLLQLKDSRNDTIKSISVYMLAEFYLEKDANKTINIVDSSELSKSSFNYALTQDLKAMALISLGKIKEAQGIYTELLQEATLSQGLQTRINNKLELIKNIN